MLIVPSWWLDGSSSCVNNVSGRSAKESREEAVLSITTRSFALVENSVTVFGELTQEAATFRKKKNVKNWRVMIRVQLIQSNHFRARLIHQKSSQFPIRPLSGNWAHDKWARNVRILVLKPEIPSRNSTWEYTPTFLSARFFFKIYL